MSGFSCAEVTAIAAAAPGCARWPLARGPAWATCLPLRGDEIASAAACCSTSKSPVPCERDVDGMQSNTRPEWYSSCRRFDSSTSWSLDGARVNARIIDLGLGPQGTTRVRLWCWCVVSSVALGSGLSEGHAEATRAGRSAASPWPTVTCTCDVRSAYDRSGCEVRLVVHSGPSDAWCELLVPGWRITADTAAIGSPEPMVMHLKRQIRNSLS